MSVANVSWVAVLLPDLRPGGAEGMRVKMAYEWIARGCDVEFVLRQASGELFHQLPDRVSVVDFGASRVRRSFGPLLRYLRDARPDVLLVAMWPLTAIAPLAAKLAGFRGRVVVSEHSAQSLAYRHKGRVHSSALRVSTWLGYRLADVRIGVSSGVADDMASLSRMSREAITVQYNPAARGLAHPGVSVLPPELEGVSSPRILAVGTLKAVKRFDVAIEAFARLPASLGATLCIVGEGQERQALQAKIDAFGVNGRVLLLGYRADTAPWYANADLFVLSSDYEGFGNVIVEALEHGVPVVSTDCPSGPREILEDGKYGRLVLVGDADALASAMLESLQSQHDHAALKARAQDFAVDKVADQYLDLLLPGWREASSKA
ncbi:glycosyltransferase [Luteimonas qiangzhengi]|uniref:glycosyltransferase n=1 Tax=Luteimonas sp. MJ146 TaxID=3129240 RepID=UPI0031BB7FBD